MNKTMKSNNKSKTYSFLLVFVLLISTSWGQIKFVDQEWGYALDKAKRENKYIFVDVYADWCMPCKRMAATAFVNDTVTEIYNRNYINVRIDAEKTIGPEVKQKFGINAYPTLLYLRPDGSLVKKVVGAMNSTQLIRTSEKIIGQSQSPVIIARNNYYASSKTLLDLKAFVSVLIKEKSDSLTIYTEKYYKESSILNLSDSLEYLVFLKHENNYKSAASQKFIAEFKKYNPEDIELKMGHFLQASVRQAEAKNDFIYIEECLHTIYPILESTIKEGMPSESEYQFYMRSQFDKKMQTLK